MAAAKSLLAATLLALASGVVALAATPAALGGNPKVEIKAADQAIAVAALLRQSDFGVGWRGGATKPGQVTGVSCPGFDPKASDLVVNGHAEATFVFQQSGVELDQEIQVFASAAAVATDFARTLKPQLVQCLAYELRKAAKVRKATVAKIPFPAVGTVSAAYRATIVAQGPHGTAKFLNDFIFFGEGKVEYTFNVVAPVGAGDQLVRFESALAEILLKRAGATPA